MKVNPKARQLILMVLVMIVMLATTASRAWAAPNLSVPGCKQVHIVKSGEYLSKIAAIYGVSWRTIADLNQLEDFNLIFPGQELCISTSSSVNVPSTGGTGTNTAIRVNANSVVEDKTVTLHGKSLDAKSTYTIYMSNYKLSTGTLYLVGTAVTDANGTFTKTFNIPKRLYDVAMIQVRLVNGRGDVAINWFINSTLSSNTGGLSAPAISLSLVEVKSDGTVRISASNLPQNVTFSVYIGKADSKGIGGVLVGKIVAPKTGKVTATFTIPDKYQDNKYLDIRVESNAIQMAAYLKFQTKAK